MKGLNCVISAVSKGATYVCIALTALMMVSVTADVILRFFFTRNIPGVTELTQGCWVLMALSFGVVALENANTMVDIFVMKMPEKIRRVIFAITDSLAIVFCVIVGWRTLLKAVSSMKANVMYVSLGVKEWPFILIFAISFFVCAAATVLVLIREVSGTQEHTEPEEKNAEEEGV